MCKITKELALQYSQYHIEIRCIMPCTFLSLHLDNPSCNPASDSISPTELIFFLPIFQLSLKDNVEEISPWPNWSCKWLLSHENVLKVNHFYCIFAFCLLLISKYSKCFEMSSSVLTLAGDEARQKKQQKRSPDTRQHVRVTRLARSSELALRWVRNGGEIFDFRVKRRGNDVLNTLNNTTLI